MKFVSLVNYHLIISPAQASADRFGSVFVRKGKPLAPGAGCNLLHHGQGCGKIVGQESFLPTWILTLTTPKLESPSKG